jgi:aspartyl-tRNA(Asn)/glutamyl-tRNA(Gln) amidotransferase subunit A
VKELRCPQDRHGGYAATLIPAVDYLQAMRLRAPMKKSMAELFEKHDVIVAPTRASVAYPADKHFEEVYPGISGGPALIPAGNLCGLPALAMPNGFGDNRLPTSISFMGPAFSEGELTALANEYQSRTQWHLERPPSV